jgi:ketosteroid isomerase-like protein
MSAAVLDGWYAAMRGGDLEAMRGVATPDIRIWWNGPPDLVSWGGEHLGVDAAIAFFRNVTGHLDVLRTTVVERIEADAAIVVFLDAHWRVKTSGAEIRAKALNVFRFRDGRVSGYEVYPDSAAFARALARD